MLKRKAGGVWCGAKLEQRSAGISRRLALMPTSLVRYPLAVYYRLKCFSVGGIFFRGRDGAVGLCRGLEPESQAGQGNFVPLAPSGSSEQRIERSAT